MRLLKMPKSLFSDTRSFRGYSHLETLRAEDLNLTITRFLHEKSGAMIYNLKANEKDNTFSPIVKTLAENSTGCPHILEHLACCGSHKFPVRDPFFNMLRRSVNTYMNAWTGQDFTAYPFSSPNRKDFENLYKVYLDMCLKPLLNELDFRQEGWRYELNPETKQKQIKGIVFNEMKGAYQNPDRQLYVEMADKLFATTPYGYDSGGKPEQIVKLSYEQVQNMHSYYYHPSNMSFYYYGDADIREKLEFLENEYLHKFNYSNNIKEYNEKSKRLMQNMPNAMQKIFYQVTSNTAESPNIGVTYNMGLLQNADPLDLACLNVISYLLFDSNQALLYQQFIEANLADSFGNGGFNLSSVLSFGVTLKNIKISSEETLAIVQKCFQTMIETGINQHRLQQYIRKTQLDILTPKQTQGITYLSISLPYMINRLPLTNLTNVRSQLNAAVNKLKDKTQLKQLIHKYFLSNNRKIVIRQEPIQNKSDEPYKNIVGLQMTEQTIVRQQQELKARQQSKQNLTQCLPKLSITDLIASQQKEYQVKKQGKTKQGNNLSEIHVQIDVKGINFVRVIFKLNMETPENRALLPYLDIWRYSIKQGIAVKGLTNKELSSKLNLYSNDFDVSIQKGSTQIEPTTVNIIFSASCLKQYLSQYLDLLHRIIYEPDFKEEDIGNIFRSYKSEKVQQLLDGSVMQYCLDYGSSMLGQQAQIFNRYLWTTEGLKIADSGHVPAEFSVIHSKLRTNSDVIVMQHTSQYRENASRNVGFTYASQETTPRKSTARLNKTFAKSNQSISVTNAYDVNFCSQQYLAPQSYSKQLAEIVLLIELLEQDFLHQKIREKGGAYGARAVYRDVGTIAFYSYMDPYSTETYAAFDQSVKQVLSATVSSERLEELKIKVIGGLELPIVPQRECVHRILKNGTIEQRKKFIQFIRLAQWSNIVSTGKKYLETEQKSRVMFGKDVPQGFSEQKLKIPKLQKVQEQQQSSSQ